MHRFLLRELRFGTGSSGPANKALQLLVLAAVFLLQPVRAQQLPVSNFVLFGGFNQISGQATPPAPGRGVQLNTGSSAQNGAIGSYTLVKLVGNGTSGGNIHSGGKVEFGNNSTAGGIVTAANTGGLSGTIFQTGSGAILSGNIDVNGNIVVTGGTVSGKVTQPAGSTYTGPTPAGGRVMGTPSLPVLPAMPDITPFPNAGNTNITGTQTIGPGAYGNMSLTGGKTVTFSSPGVYVFNSIANSGTFNNFTYNFQNNASGTIRIYVHGDADMGKLSVKFQNGGSAAQVFAEVHGTGSTTANPTFAFNLTSGASGAKFSEWQGTVWAPYAGIRVGSGASSSKVSGALWSGTHVFIESNVAINHVPYVSCPVATSANAGPDKLLTCTVASLQLSGSSATAGAQYSWTASGGGAIVSGAATATPSVNAAGTYTLTVTNPASGCKATDEAIVTRNATLPHADAGPDKLLTCTVTSLQLSGSSTTAGVSYSWTASGGGALASGAATATPTVNTPGTYTLTVTNPTTGCKATDVALVTRNNTVPDASAGPDQQLTCTVNSLQLNGSSATSGVSYSWTASGGGVINSGAGTATPDVTSAGTYTLTVTNLLNSCTATDVALVTRNITPPNANAGPDKQLTCAAPALQLSGSSATAGATYSWTASGGGQISANAGTATPTVNAAGTYTLTVTNPANGCTATDQASVSSNTTPPPADAGPDRQITCTILQAQLGTASSSTALQYSWSVNQGGNSSAGQQTAQITVHSPGTYTLTVTDPANGCSSTDEAIVARIPCIFPYYKAPPQGKVYDLLGSELNMLYNMFTTTGLPADTLEDIFLRKSDSVYIEIIAVEGQEQNLLTLLQSSQYGITDLIDNGPGSIIISGKYPIGHLLKLDSLPQFITYCRPLFPAISSSGVAYTNGDIAMRSDFARNGFNVSGEGVKVGVISDSYNTQPGNPALTDVLNGDLPGAGNPLNPTPVQRLREFPYGRRSDEGRAMMQIVHDIAPKAALAFRTGFISSGDFAQGIRQLQQNNCDIIVDDVTYITEPYFQDGVVAQAVDYVTSQGVTYFSAAGNFGSKSYQGTFSPLPAPAGLAGHAHNFSGGDMFQNVTLTPGTYTVVLQWQDSVYSNGQTQTGTQNDLDIYLTYDDGITLFGFNRDNTGGDPLEVLPFTVSENTTTNILIRRETGSQNVQFKYIVYRGDLTATEYNTNSSTLVGQANAEGAIAVGAVLYTNTPAYGVNPPTPASFSSRGGTPVNGVVRNKPDIMAPNGVNTTVNLGGVNIDGDAFPNFFGTSAAAPHAAAVAALLLNAKQKFYNQDISPAQMKDMLHTYVYDMGTPGFDHTNGYGFVRADQAMLSMAAPIPVVTELVLPDTSTVPGEEPFTLTINGSGFTTQSTLFVRGNPVPTTFVALNQLTAAIDTFFGNPPLVVCNPAFTPSGLDGGCSDTLYFFSPVKRAVTVIADNKAKKYGQQLPEFTASILVDNVPLAATGLTLADLGLTQIQYQTPATSTSNVGIYYIRPSTAPLNPADPFDAGLLEQYTYEFTDGLLTIEKLPLTITPRDTTLTYGDRVGGFAFDYQYNDSLITLPDNAVLLNAIHSDHQASLTNALGLVDGRAIVNGRSLQQSDVMGLALTVTGRAIVNTRIVVDGRAIVNGGMEYDTTRVVDVAVASIFNYQVNPAEAPLVSALTSIGGRAIVNAGPFVNGLAVIGGRAIVNGSGSLLNTNTVNTNSTPVVVIIDEADVEAPPGDSVEIYKSINAVTGLTVGQHFIVPGALLSENFDITYGLGTLQILPATLTVEADDQTVSFGQQPAYTSAISGYRYADSAASVLAGPPVYTLFDNQNNPVTTTPVPAGSYRIQPGALPLIAPANYNVVYEPGTLTVTPVVAPVSGASLSDYVLFGGFPAVAGQAVPSGAGRAVQFGTGSGALGGAVGSYNLVTMAGNGNINGNVHSGNRVVLSNNGTITGHITAANSDGLANAIMQTGSGAVLGGNLDVQGNISIASGTVSGRVTQPAWQHLQRPGSGRRTGNRHSGTSGAAGYACGKCITCCQQLRHQHEPDHYSRQLRQHEPLRRQNDYFFRHRRVCV